MKIILIITLILSFNTFADGTEAGFVDNENILTDQEVIESENFVHRGKSQRLFEESCKKSDGAIKELCNNGESAFEGNFGKLIEKFAPMVPVLMSTVLGSGGLKRETGNKIVNGQVFEKQKDGSFVNTKASQKDATTIEKQTLNEDQINQARENGSKVKDETESITDFCVHIPTIVETGVQAYKLLSKDSIEDQFNSTDQGARQKASLIAVKQSQESQKTASTIQFAGWGSTAACYTAYLFAGTVVSAPFVGKMSASILLTTFYGYKIKAHNERINALNEIIAKLPKAGECNPHTETTCFCNEETSITTDPQNFKKRCVPPPFEDRFGNAPVSCVDSNGKADNQCLCKKSNTCIGERLKGGFAKVGLNPTTVAPILQGLGPVDNGTANGDIEGITRRNISNANKALKRIKKSQLPNFKLSPKQKKLASSLSNLGIPKFAAAAIASTPVNKAGLNMATAATTDSADEIFSNPELKNAFRQSRIRYSGTKGSFGKKRKRKKRSSFNPFAFGKKKKGAGNSGSDVMILDDYQRKAAAKAEINRDKGKNIFDIITYRYTMSAWKKFEDQIKKEESKNQK